MNFDGLLTLTCPVCWQATSCESPPYDPDGVCLVTDCEVCCRPLVVDLWWDDPEEPPLADVRAETE